MRNKLLFWNTASSILLQITTIVSGFVLPRFILQYYGSEINGLVCSIAQFLRIISFLEFGVGAVVQSALYKPLADKDTNQISKIIQSANSFFFRLAQILLLYVVVLMFLYPIIMEQKYDWIYTGTLILAISISYFAQYYFGVVDRILLNADQHGYVNFNVQTLTLIANTIVCVLLMKIECSIQIVKLTTSFIYLLRPIILRKYVNNHYNIDRSISYTGEPLKQKWNGLAQHVATIVLENVGMVTLTLFSSLTNVSIYNIYILVILGLKQFIMAITAGIQSILGELWAKRKLTELNFYFELTEWGMHNMAVFIWGCTAVLITPFVKVYTNGINDANYDVPVFAAILVFSHALHSLRLPYNVMILAAGHYKETQVNYIIATLLNVVISIIGVKVLDLNGSAIGGVIALGYQVLWMAIYNSKKIIKWPFRNFLKQCWVDTLSISFGLLFCSYIYLGEANTINWIKMSVKVSLVFFLVLIFTNFIFYKDKLQFLLSLLNKKSDG